MLRRAIQQNVHARLTSTEVTSKWVPCSKHKQTPITLIGTHNGNFHCDEALACAMLLHTAPFSNSQILRTRNPEWLEKCDVIVDVGAVYDAANHRYDHHQNSFQEKMTTPLHTYTATKLSSAGLIYRHFGASLIEGFSKELVMTGALSKMPTERELAIAYDRVYSNFIEHIDGNDNGVDAYRSAAVEGAGGSAAAIPNFYVTTALPSRVAHLFPETSDPTEEEINQCFVEAMTLCATEFYQAIARVLCTWLPSRALVEVALRDATAVHSSGAIALFKSGGLPWKEHLFTIEKELHCEGKFQFVLFQDLSKSWRVMTVPDAPGSFRSRRALKWCGLRDDGLCKESGIDGCIFVHASGFIGGNSTYEGALAMAVASLCC